MKKKKKKKKKKKRGNWYRVHWAKADTNNDENVIDFRWSDVKGEDEEWNC